MSFIWNVVFGLITMRNCDIIVYPGSPWYYFMWLQCLVVIIQLHFIDILYNIHGQMTICIWLYGIIIIFHCGFVDLIHYKRSQTRTFSSGWTTFRWPFQGRTKPWNTGVTQWSVGWLQMQHWYSFLQQCLVYHKFLVMLYFPHSQIKYFNIKYTR